VRKGATRQVPRAGCARDRVDTSLGNGVTLITLAPEEVPPADIRAFVERGAIVFGGHSAASYEQARAGIASGIRGFTHLYNAMSQLVGREPGMAGAALDDRIPGWASSPTACTCIRPACASR
jgi:N-acetylglucosamine-6-phosphate deacetylase